jgi:hypothetical protein
LWQNNLRCNPSGCGSPTGPFRQKGPLPTLPFQDYPFDMSELPASYKEFLADKSEMFISTVKPVLQQSAADKLHGVRVTYNPGPTGHQAHLDDTLPYGVVIEDID